ncbi:CGNR zinc finger domain-containing protein [Nonomuraea sp. NPDC050536]|uniref:CGNR zinc finger domain-containing protein n=1 Tax=Nonomuraea sp. NPDC050536 TaxID=3364366 RepID=UPI0037CA6E40
MTRFTFVSGNVALDLAGTVQHRRTDRTDLLDGPEALSRWITEAGLLTSAPPAGAPDLAATKALREAIYRLATDAAQPHDRDTLNAFAATPPAQVRLAAAEGVERLGPVPAALSTVARAAIELLGGPDHARIKQCGADQCTRLFVDTSRASSRRWCDMLECGNRAKAAGFRARHRVT